MAKYASKVVEQAKAWLGKKESDGSYKVIINTYNSQKPLPSGYKVKCIANGDKINDAWCATFASAVAVKLGYTDIIPTECSCGRMIDKFKAIDCWKEDESVTPKAGWFIFYDWSDQTGKGDNKGIPDHVGIVEKVVGNTIYVIEGNYSKSVKRRTIDVNGRYIRGYGVPKYDTEKTSGTGTSNSNKKTNVVKNSKEAYRKQFIKDVQKAIGAKVDGIAGTETLSKTVTVSKNKNNKHAVVKSIQVYLNKLGYSCGAEDGIAGVKFDKAVKKYQKDYGCEVDGEITAQGQTWKKLLGLV